jgi:hypothetical protein
MKEIVTKNYWSNPPSSRQPFFPIAILSPRFVLVDTSFVLSTELPECIRPRAIPVATTCTVDHVNSARRGRLAFWFSLDSPADLAPSSTRKKTSGSHV